MQYHIMIKNLSKSYQSKGAAKTALSDVTLNIPQGEIFCIMGSSGSGKSTLLKIFGVTLLFAAVQYGFYRVATKTLGRQYLN